MQKPFFSIVVVSLNPGERLEKTLDSIVKQTFGDYEVILKDGGSKDKSLQDLIERGYFEDKKQIKIRQTGDKSIYDGMNQAVSLVTGSYVQFLNCGDCFYTDTVLEEVAKFIKNWKKTELPESKPISNRKKQERISKDGIFREPLIFYGNQYNQLQQALVYSAPKMNDFTCYRNVPCHQVCFYDSRLFGKRAYDLKYRVRADYEHFLYSIYKENAKGISMPVVIVSYEGGGFSETAENRRKSALEHREITAKYLGKSKVLKYRMILWLTLAPLRTWMAENPALSGVYHGIKNGIYSMLRR